MQYMKNFQVHYFVIIKNNQNEDYMQLWMKFFLITNTEKCSKDNNRSAPNIPSNDQASPLHQGMYQGIQSYLIHAV